MRLFFPPSMVLLAEQPVPGQRWVSDTEPELGLGIVLKTEFGRVEIFFPAAGEHRVYAIKSAPLRRVRFRKGDRIHSHDGEELIVESVDEVNDLIIYKTGARDLPEAELLDTISFSQPLDRLLAGQIDELRAFDLRVEALERQSELRRSPLRGFVGGRIDLIPHQLYIADEVASRLAPRVLLADEVGLGKTIEACLILHRLHLTGRADRILVLVPEPLVHQWFVELLRRFNLLFSIFDEERCVSIERGDEGANPFLDSQLVLCGIDLMSGNETRARQAIDAGWDLVVVDEAHHLEWTPEEVSPAYQLVEELGAITSGLLLLTATPQQLGRSGHFARLRLLDPDRYSDLEAYQEEAEHYEEVAGTVDRLLDGGELTAEDRALFAEKSERIRRHSEALAEGDEEARGKLVTELVDEFGTGRVMFRNTRKALSGFPERQALLVPIEADVKSEEIEIKAKWLAGLLKELGEGEKVLAICRTRELAEAATEALQSEINVKVAVFHEGLTLLQRDRNAAFFAEDDGARVLICSEIGSEGRNFQFAHHLALLDLPGEPDLLEQRIGRLDRIGQEATIQIHVPYFASTSAEVLARWYHEGMNAFEESLHGSSDIVRETGDQLAALLEKFDAKGLDKLVAATVQCHAEVAQRLERGHDRLLELNSNRPERAAVMFREIRELDQDGDFEDFLLRLFDSFGLDIEDLGDRAYLIKRGNLITDALPALPDEGLAATFRRYRALSREERGFMSRDHPMVRGALDTLLGSEMGNTAFGVVEEPGADEGLLLEVYAIAEAVAPSALHVDRFLAPTPIRIVVDNKLGDESGNEAINADSLFQGDSSRFLTKASIKQKLVPAMLKQAEELAEERLAILVKDATAASDACLSDEIERLRDLSEINDHVRPEEVIALEAQRDQLAEAIRGAGLRIDAVRLIWRVSDRRK